jgi:hypothetical protein
VSSHLRTREDETVMPHDTAGTAFSGSVEFGAVKYRPLVPVTSLFDQRGNGVPRPSVTEPVAVRRTPAQVQAEREHGLLVVLGVPADPPADFRHPRDG